RSAIELLVDGAKHSAHHTMLGRDTVKRRLEGDGISYTEFSYMLLQANDYLQLRRNMGCTLQIGGSDQWGNIVGGVDLNRRVDGESVHGVTVPLVTASDGTKFGKSTAGRRHRLPPEMTSPYTWYHYFLNSAAADVVRYLRWFSFLGRAEIDELDAATRGAPHPRAAQKRLAEEMTTLVHGVAATESVQAASRALFGRGEEGVLGSLDESTLAAALEDAGAVSVEPGEPSGIIDLLVATGLSESRGAARRAVSEGGAYVNNERISDPEWEPQRTDLLHGGWLVLRRGKKS